MAVKGGIPQPPAARGNPRRGRISRLIRFIRRLHWGFKVLGILAVGFVAVVWYLARTAVLAPAPLADWLQQRLEKLLGAEVRFTGLEVRLQENLLRATGLSLRKPDQKTAVEIETLTCRLGSGTTIGQLIRGDLALECTEIDGGRIDALALRDVLRGATFTATPTSSPAEVPLKRLIGRNLHLELPFGGIDLPRFHLDIQRVSGEIQAGCEIASHPFGGTASLAVRLAFDRSWGSCDLVLRGCSLERAFAMGMLFAPVPLAWKLAMPLIGVQGLLDLDLHWQGNPAALASSPRDGLWRMATRELTGSVHLREGELRLGTDRLGVEVSLGRPGGEPWSGTIDLRQAAGKLHLEGRWLPEEEAFGRIGTRFGIDHFSISPAWLVMAGAFEPRLAPGFIDAHGNLIYDGRHIETEGVASFTDWGWQGVPVPPLTAAWKQSGTRIEASASLEIGGGQVSGNGAIEAIGPGQGNFTIDGELSGLRLPFLEKLEPLHFAGRTSGDFHLDGNVTRPASITYDLDLAIEEPRLFGIAGSLLRGGLCGTGRDWRVLDPGVIFPDGGSLALAGSIASDGFDCRVVADRLDPRRFRPTQEWAEGKVSLEGTLQGAFEAPHLEGELWTTPLDVAGIRAEGLKSHLLIDGRRLELHPVFVALADGGQIDGSVSLDLRTGHLLGLRLLVSDLPVANLPVGHFPWLRALDPRGRIGGTVEHHPLEKGAIWSVDLGGSRLMLASETISRFDLEGSFTADRFDLRRLQVEACDGTLSARGSGRLATPAWNGEISLRDLNLAKVETLRRLLPETSGTVSAQGELAWNARQHEGRFTLFGKNLVIRRQELGNLGAEIGIDRNGLFVNRCAIDRLGVEVVGSMAWDPGFPYHARVSMSGTDLSFLPASLGMTGFRKGDLLVDGAATLEGRGVASLPEFLEARLDSVEIRRNNDVVVANKPIDLHFQHGRLEVRSLELKYRQGVFGIEGVYDPFGQVGMTLSGKDFSLLALGSLLEIPQWSTDGSLSLDGTISGPASEPRLEGDLEIRRLTVAGRTIPEIEARIRVDPGEIALSPMVVKLKGNQVTFEGRMPFREGWNMGDLDLSMKIPAGPLDDLPLLFPEVFRLAKGQLRADLRFSGNPRRPAVTGDLRLDASELAFTGMGKPLRQVILGMRTENQVVQVGPLEAQLGRGKITGGGEIDFRGGPGTMSLRLDGENLDLAWEGIDLQRNSAHFTAGGNLYNPVVRGKILLPRGRVQLAENLLSKLKFRGKTPFETLDFEIQVEIPRNLWVRNSMLNAEMRGKFKVFGDLNSFHLHGNVQTVQGALYFQRRKFLIENGEIRFGEREGTFDPHVYVKSTTNIQNTQIYMTLEGLLSQIKPRLYSSPPLAEGDILALITLGRNLDQMDMGGSRGQLEKDILENLKNTYLTGLLSSTLSSAFNLDEMYFGSLFDRTTGVSRSFLRIGKYLGHNVFLAYEGTLSNEDKKTYIIEYRLPRGFLLNLEVEKPTNATRIGVKYDWKF